MVKHKTSRHVRPATRKTDGPSQEQGAGTAPKNDVPPAGQAGATPASAPRLQSIVLVTGRVALIAAVVIAALLHIVHTFTRPPDFDEHIHLQFLWLTSQGLLPDRDFLCPYPSAPFHLLAPVIEHLPQRPSVFILLRLMTLLPVALIVGMIAVAAHALKRDAWIATAIAAVLIGSGEVPSLLELRLDVFAWAPLSLAFVMLIMRQGFAATALASALTVLSLFISPKHAIFAAAIALAFGIDRLLAGRRVFLRSMLAALAGMAATCAVLTMVHPTAVPDSIRLSFMNIVNQRDAQYPETLFQGLMTVALRDPLVMTVFWVAPVLFVLHARGQPRHVTLLYGGALAGALLTVLTLPCGWTQYVSLAWMLFAFFIPWMTPRANGRWMPAAVSLLLAAGAAGYAIDDLPDWSSQRINEQIRIQNEMARLCPPGELDVGAPFAHAWFRRTPGYVFVDETTSYRNVLPPARARYFTDAYFYAQLTNKIPATICGTSMSAAPPEYSTATIRFLDSPHGTNYGVVAIPCLHQPGVDRKDLLVYVRLDLITNALISRRLR